MMVYILNFLSFSPAAEPLALLIFGAALFSLTAGLRSLLNKSDKSAEALMQELNSKVVIEGDR